MIQHSSRNKITKNHIHDNYHQGILIAAQVIPIDLWYTDITIEFNNISHNKWCAIQIEGIATRIKIRNNHFESNHLTGVAVQHIFLSFIENNNFINNTKNAIFRTSFIIRWNGNYWDDWDRSTPRPIIGQIGIFKNPIIKNPVPWIDFDWHPVAEPYDIP